MKLLRFAAIDIGSNAVRLLFTNVVENSKKPVFKKSSLIRVPIRLGEDAFIRGKISSKLVDKLVKTMHAFRNLMEVHEVIDYMACATSAMREAKNGLEVANHIRRETGIPIEIIDGQREAEIIYSNQIVELIDDDNHYLYVDVGGGSTEVTLFSSRKLISSQSFDIGTIRMLKEKVATGAFKAMKDWLKALRTDGKEVSIIGSGGNINKILKISGRKDNQSLVLEELSEINRFISYYTIEERIKVLGLNPDRADVIVPATEIYLNIMKWTGARRIIVPTIGVSDGIVHQLYNEYKRRSSTPMML